MCGRFGLAAKPEDIAAKLEVSPDDLNYAGPRFNIAPSTNCIVIRHDARRRRRPHAIKWGLIPSWAKDAGIGAKLTNARSETVSDKPSFRDAFARRRCLILTDGFYEWRRDEEGKTPFHIGMRDNSVFAFGGLWERWREPSGTMLDSFAILTTTPNAVMRPIHHRMPVIIAPEHYDHWLDRQSPPETLRPLLRPCNDGWLTRWEVSTLVNHTRNDTEACRAPVAPR
jgi:putative SOS response-associated peptidase YedK